VIVQLLVDGKVTKSVIHGVIVPEDDPGLKVAAQQANGKGA
jgi:hypothetical protein